MKAKVGDRFRGRNHEEIWEIIETGEGDDLLFFAKGEVIDPNHCASYYKGYTATYSHWHEICHYLGNFGKSSSFNTLYEKLNNT